MNMELTPNQVHALMPQMPAAARDPASGLSYDGTNLTIPDAFADAAQAVMAVKGWDAAVAVVPLATGRQIFGQAKIAGVSAALVTFLGKTPKPDDALYWYGIGLDTLVPTDNPKVGRLLVGAGVPDVPGFMSAALALVA